MLNDVTHNMVVGRSRPWPEIVLVIRRGLPFRDSTSGVATQSSAWIVLRAYINSEGRRKKVVPNPRQGKGYEAYDTSTGFGRSAEQSSDKEGVPFFLYYFLLSFCLSVSRSLGLSVSVSLCLCVSLLLCSADVTEAAGPGPPLAKRCLGSRFFALKVAQPNPVSEPIIQTPIKHLHQGNYSPTSLSIPTFCPYLQLHIIHHQPSVRLLPPHPSLDPPLRLLRAQQQEECRNIPSPPLLPEQALRH